MTPKPYLSILIPTVYGREKEFQHLKSRLVELSKNLPATLVECRVSIDDKSMTIGEKRENMYKEANGDYSWMIDDDDDIADDAISRILKAVLSGSNADCITFQEHVDIDGKIQRSNHSLKYSGWYENYDGFDYVRTPFFKSVIKTEIARSVPIPHIRFGEDHIWSIALKDKLKSEIHIDQQLYKYIHRSSDFNERYGIK